MSDSLSSLFGGIHSVGALPAPQVINPLADFAAATQTARGVYDLRGQQATEALGQTYQQAIDPSTGRFDPLKFNALLAANPRAAMAAQSGVESGQKLQGEQFTLGGAELGHLNDAVSSTLKLPNNQLQQAVLQQTQRLVDMGVVPRDHAMSFLSQLPSDPAQLRTQLETLRINTLPPDSRQTTIYGSPHTQTGLGGQTVGFTVDPTDGTIRMGKGGAPQGLSPTELMTTIDQPDLRKQLPDGTPNPDYLKSKKIPLWQFYGLPGPPGMDGGEGVGSGRPPPALVNPKGPQPAAAQPPYKQPSAASPGEEGEAKLAPAQFQAESQHASDAVMQQSQLGTMLSDLAGFTAGTGAGKTLDFKRALESWAPPVARAFGLKSDEVAKQESFDKLAAQIVQMQNPGSDSRMNLNMAATPHSSLSPEGADYIIRTLQGNADYLQARGALARAYPSRSDYNGFQTSVAKLDPRVFQLERMTQDQRDDYIGYLKKSGGYDELVKSAQLVAKMRQAGQI